MPVKRIEPGHPESQWSGRAIASPLVIAFVLLLEVGLFRSLTEIGEWASIIGLISTAPLLGTFMFVRVDVSDKGLEVRLGPVGWPRLCRAFDELEDARAIDVFPLWFGGWGYRLIRGGWAVVIRGGEALELQMKAGRRFIVTVDGAGEAVADIDSILARREVQGRTMGAHYIV